MYLISNSAILGIYIKFFPLEKETHLQTTNSLGSMLVFRGVYHVNLRVTPAQETRR